MDHMDHRDKKTTMDELDFLYLDERVNQDAEVWVDEEETNDMEPSND